MKTDENKNKTITMSKLYKHAVIFHRLNMLPLFFISTQVQPTAIIANSLGMTEILPNMYITYVEWNNGTELFTSKFLYPLSDGIS